MVTIDIQPNAMYFLGVEICDFKINLANLKIKRRITNQDRRVGYRKLIRYRDKISSLTFLSTIAKVNHH